MIHVSFHFLRTIVRVIDDMMKFSLLMAVFVLIVASASGFVAYYRDRDASYALPWVYLGCALVALAFIYYLKSPKARR